MAGADSICSETRNDVKIPWNFLSAGFTVVLSLNSTLGIPAFTNASELLFIYELACARATSGIPFLDTLMNMSVAWTLRRCDDHCDIHSFVLTSMIYVMRKMKDSVMN